MNNGKLLDVLGKVLLELQDKGSMVQRHVIVDAMRDAINEIRRLSSVEDVNSVLQIEIPSSRHPIAQKAMPSGVYPPEWNDGWHRGWDDCARWSREHGASYNGGRKVKPESSKPESYGKDRYIKTFTVDLVCTGESHRFEVEAYTWQEALILGKYKAITEMGLPADELGDCRVDRVREISRPEDGQGFLNLYVNTHGRVHTGGIYKDEESAAKTRKPHFFCTVPVSWPVDGAKR